MSKFNGKLALVTGASRGIGASVSRILAERGANIIINYHSKSSRAEEVVNSVRAAGRRATLIRADITNEDEVRAMMKTVEEVGRLDLLILNASGGLEKDKPAEYAMQLNFFAQERIVDLASSHMTKDGRVVFITSHLAHFYGHKPVYPAYESIAASKHAGEQALRARIPELTTKGISLVVVSGDLIEGTITPKLMERSNRGLIEMRRQQAGSLPTVEEFSQAIVDAAGDMHLKSGDVVFVGSIE